MLEERTTPTKQRRSIFYGWYLVGLSAVVMALLTGPSLSGLPVWTIVLRARFGWTPSQLALGYSMQRAESSVLGPIAGYLTDKLGTRRIVPIGLVIFGTGFIAFSQIHELWQFYLSFLIISMGSGLAGWLALMTMLNRWFVRRKSLAMSISLEGLWIGGIAIVPALAWFIDPDKYGLERWRDIALLLGVLVILLAIPIGYLLRNRPEDKNQVPDGKRPDMGAIEGRPRPSQTGSRSQEEPPMCCAPGGAACTLGGTKAPSTLGTFLRSFRWGHVRQLDRVSRELLARAWQAGAGPGDGPLTIDLDSTICETYGLAKEGARHHGYTGKRGF